MLSKFKNFPKNNRFGFTLIELIIAISIIAILAAIALPRFAAIDDEAELNTVKYTAASFKQGVESVKQVFTVGGYATRIQNLPNFGNGTIDTNNIGYPIGTNKGNGNENIGVGNNGCVGVWNGLMSNPPSVANGNNNSDFRSYRHTGNRMCSYVYRLNGDTGNRNTSLLVIEYDSRDGNVRVCGQRSDIPDC